MNERQMAFYRRLMAHMVRTHLAGYLDRYTEDALTDRCVTYGLLHDEMTSKAVALAVGRLIDTEEAAAAVLAETEA